VDYDVFYLPPIEPQYGNPILVGGDITAMLRDKLEVRVLMQYLTLGESLKMWLQTGGTFAVPRDIPPVW
jgi:alpha-glucoside transport system substrate-binding protein